MCVCVCAGEQQGANEAAGAKGRGAQGQNGRLCSQGEGPRAAAQSARGREERARKVWGCQAPGHPGFFFIDVYIYTHTHMYMRTHTHSYVCTLALFYSLLFLNFWFFLKKNACRKKSKSAADASCRTSQTSRLRPRLRAMSAGIR